MNSETMNIKQSRIGKLNEIIERFNAEEIRTEEGRALRDEVSGILRKFIECYSSAELSSVETRTILDPLRYVVQNRIIASDSREHLALTIIVNDVWLSFSQEEDDWYNNVLINVPQKILDTGAVDQEALKEHIELVEYVRSRFGEIDTTMNEMVRLVKWIGMQPEIAAQFQMTEETEGYDDFVKLYFTIPGQNM